MTASDDKAATVKVIDTGTGIPRADLPHVFERFYKADKSRTNRRQRAWSGHCQTHHRSARRNNNGPERRRQGCYVQFYCSVIGLRTTTIIPLNRRFPPHLIELS